MIEAHAIWRLGRWLGGRQPGVVHLQHSNGELLLRIRGGHIVGVEGIEGAVASQALGRELPPNSDLLTEAHRRAATSGLSETEAVGVVKRLVQKEISIWYADAERKLEITDEVPADCQGHTISATHAVVELLLSDPDGELTSHVLPDPNVLLRRSEGFLDLYVPLGLSEEADLIVAKITGQRTAGEIISRSPQPEEEVGRLLAALTATGMLEAAPVPEAEDDLDLKTELESPFVSETDETPKRIGPVLILLAAVCLAVAATLIWWFTLRQPSEASPVTQDGRWGVVIDLGCEPHEYRRLLEVAQRHRNVQAVAVSETGGDAEGCWRLVWGTYPTTESAQQAIATIPDALTRDGFEPHPIKLPTTTQESDGGK